MNNDEKLKIEKSNIGQFVLGGDAFLVLQVLEGRLEIELPALHLSYVSAIV